MSSHDTEVLQITWELVSKSVASEPMERWLQIIFLVQVVIKIYMNSSEYTHICNDLGNAFQPVVLGSCQNWGNYECSKIPSIMQQNEESVWLATASFFTVTMMPNTLSVHYKHIGIEKHTPENYQSWIVLPRAQISTLLTQCGIVLTENDAKGSKHPEKSFECPLNKPGELLLKRWQKLRVQIVLKNNGDFHTHEDCTQSVFALYAVLQCFNKTLHLFSIFLSNYKEMRSGLRFLHSIVFLGTWLLSY